MMIKTLEKSTLSYKKKKDFIKYWRIMLLVNANLLHKELIGGNKK